MEGQLATMAGWSRRRWLAGLGGGIAIAVLVAFPTAVIPNPVFGRAVAVTWWSYPIVVMTGILGGLLFATYVRDAGSGFSSESSDDLDRGAKFGLTGTLVSFLAVGCPVCNKLVLLALGASGAVTWFAPFQPVLALASILLMAIALRFRMRNAVSCRISTPTTTTPWGV
jgi:uncharacterized membrane protein (DUF485 family)